ncbi:MAG: hypothetical protein MUO53_13360 [Maribacter sp.]|nr:hypothetical protein [Maribacter sp.]
MKTKLFLIVSGIIVFFSIGACTKEEIGDCLITGNSESCIPPIPTETSILAEGQKMSDSTLAVSKLPYLE